MEQDLSFDYNKNPFDRTKKSRCTIEIEKRQENMLTTSRLQLIPLTLDQLKLGLGSIKELAVALNLPLVDTLMQGVAERAAGMKIEKMSKVPVDVHEWYTYWLIVITCENIGAGMVGFKGQPNAAGEVEIGYGIDPVFQGFGYTTEAVRELVRWAFSHPECKAITATGVLPDNYASQKVLVKAGFQEIGSDENGVSFRLER